MKFRSGGVPRSVEDQEREENERREEDVRRARIEIARANPDWVELEEVDLFRRGPRFLRVLVAASDDAVYTVHGGQVFVTGSTTLIATRDPRETLYWFADRNGGLVFLDRGPETWSELVERREGRLAGNTRRMVAPRRS